jgi:ABC-type branched-subunit amino acid transport system substrate-binding protein
MLAGERSRPRTAAAAGRCTRCRSIPGATNVSAQLGRLRDAGVQAIYFPATEQELQVVLPQIEYFGLAGVQMLGNEAWISDAARSLPQRVLQGAIIATPLWQESSELAWRDFVDRYEGRTGAH